MDALLLSRLQVATATRFQFGSLLAIEATAAFFLESTLIGVIGLYPRLFASNINPDYSLTAFNASSSPFTLKIMLIVVILFIPVVIGYQVWAYTLFRGKVTEAELNYEEAY